MRAWSLSIALLLGCQPAPEERRPSFIDGPRLLAVRAQPAEARPGATITLEALRVDAIEPPTFAFCVKGRSAAEYNAVDDACLGDGPFIIPIAATATLPLDGCALFGSEPRPPPPGQPPLRPADPDETGGYFQPVRVAGRTIEGFGAVRLSCELPAVPAGIAQAYRERFRPNRNPTGLTLELTEGRLTARWDPESREPFVRFDVASGQLEERSERLRISWFSTGSPLPTDVTEVPEGNEASLEFPLEGRLTRVWAVLRDDRGGITWAFIETG